MTSDFRKKRIDDEMSHRHKAATTVIPQNASTETLTEEQQYFLQLSPRQEPQGEENVKVITSPSLTSSLDSQDPNSSYNALGIHGNGVEDGLLRSPASFSVEDLAKQQMTSTPSNYALEGKRNTFPRRRDASKYPELDCYGADPDPVEKRAHLRSALGAAYREQMKVLEEITKETRHLNMLDRYLDDVSHYSAPSSSESSGSRFSQLSTLMTDREDASRLSISDTLLTDGISPYGHRQNRLSSSTCSSAYDSWMNDVLKTPPKIAPSIVQSPKRATRLRRTVSRSQPDLSKSRNKRDEAPPTPSTPATEIILAKTSPRKSPKVEKEDCWTNGELLDTLLQENLILKEEIRLQAGKLERLERLESELCAVQASHQALVRLNERRESLERTARLRLENEIRNLQEINKDLHNQVNMLTGRILGSAGTESLDREISQRDMVIAQLMSQNKELMSYREQQELELAAQRATLQEQRKHIDLLDAALAARSQCKCQFQQYPHQQQQSHAQAPSQHQPIYQELGARRLEGEASGLRSSQRSQGSVRSTGTDSGDSGITATEGNFGSPPPAYPLPTSDSGHLRQQLWEAHKHIEMLRSQVIQWQKPPGAIYEAQPPAGQPPVPPQDAVFQRSHLRATMPARRPSPLPPRASLRSLPPTKFPAARGAPPPSLYGSTAQIGNSSLSIATRSDQRTRDFSSPGRVDLGHTASYYRLGHSPSPGMTRTPSSGSGSETKFPSVKGSQDGASGSRCQLTSYVRVSGAERNTQERQPRTDSMIQALRNEQQRYPGHFQ